MGLGPGLSSSMHLFLGALVARSLNNRVFLDLAEPFLFFGLSDFSLIPCEATSLWVPGMPSSGSLRGLHIVNCWASCQSRLVSMDNSSSW